MNGYYAAFIIHEMRDDVQILIRTRCNCPYRCRIDPK